MICHRVTPDWVIAEKPAPLLIHPTRPDGEPTFWKAMLDQFPGEELCLMNRLDRETSGLVLVSRNKETSSILGKMGMERRIQKSYLALVSGEPPDEGEIDQPLLRRADVEESPTYVQQIVHPEGKPARTRFRKLETRQHGKQAISLLEVELLTGRMHQIRVHFQHLGFPVIGDKLYGPDLEYYLRVHRDGWDDSMLEGLLLRRQALHAHRLAFDWKDEHIEVISPLPDDLRSFWEGCS